MNHPHATLPEPPGGRPHPEDEERSPTQDRRPVARPLPHERDQDAEQAEGAGSPRGLTEQAARDIARGLRDTERRGAPSDVPGPGPAPERSPGAAVPPGGVQPDK